MGSFVLCVASACARALRQSSRAMCDALSATTYAVCCSTMRVGRDAHSIVFNYGQGALPWVQKLIAEDMQDLMEDLLASLCCGPLEHVPR